MNENLFIGIDIGGTKISAGLINEHGQIISRLKRSTPGKNPKEVFAAICDIIETLLSENRLDQSEIKGIGMGIPGILNKKRDKVVVSPNAAVANFAFPTEIEKKFKIKTVMENDVNMGLLGEKWLGAAKDAEIPVGIFPGTGIGGAIILNGELFLGANGAGTEIGHMFIDANGPKCGCKNSGCLESMASRRAIERDIREAIKRGEKTVITKYSGKNPKTIKSGMLKKALKKKDKVVTHVLKTASEHIGLHCVSIRHLLDPDMIVFGGGLIEACGDFMLPIIKKVISLDKYFANVPQCKIVKAKLGDDAAILGAVALVQQKLGLNLYGKTIYPRIAIADSGHLLVNKKVFDKSIFVRADGKVKKIKSGAKKGFFTKDGITVKFLKKFSKKGPETLIVGFSGGDGPRPDINTVAFLKEKKLHLRILPIDKAVELFNSTKGKKSLVLQIV